jgi:hypothetical protein
VDGASGSDLQVGISGRCAASEWHNAPQATSRTEEMIHIGAIRVTIARSGKAKATFRLLGDPTEAQFDVSTPRESRLSRIAHPQEAETTLVAPPDPHLDNDSPHGISSWPPGRWNGIERQFARLSGARRRIT